jgi:hypothetical protein
LLVVSRVEIDDEVSGFGPDLLAQCERHVDQFPLKPFDLSLIETPQEVTIGVGGIDMAAGRRKRGILRQSVHVVEAVSLSDEPKAEGLELVEAVCLGANLVSRQELAEPRPQIQVFDYTSEEVQTAERGKSFVGRFELGNHCSFPDQFGNHSFREPRSDAFVWRQASLRGSSF